MTLLLFIYRSVSRACAQLTSIDSQMVDAVEARQELDLRIGQLVIECTM